MNHQENSSITRKIRSFSVSNYNKHYEAPCHEIANLFKRYHDSAQKGYYNKNYEKHSNHNASKHAQTNYSKSRKFKEPPKKLALIVKEGLRTKEIFLERSHCRKPGTIKPSPTKTLAVQKFPEPTTINSRRIYPVKTVSAESALEKLKQQQKTFGNPIRIISDRGSAFTSKLFNDYCDEENIQHLQIATGVPRGNETS
ncbi:pro-Pol polyprotein [Trichonephila clavipes]|nr:pro-Pol polyprotein [Trichonephila clavipes]